MPELAAIGRQWRLCEDLRTLADAVELEAKDLGVRGTRGTSGDLRD